MSETTLESATRNPESTISEQVTEQMTKLHAQVKILESRCQPPELGRCVDEVESATKRLQDKISDLESENAGLSSKNNALVRELATFQNDENSANKTLQRLREKTNNWALKLEQCENLQTREETLESDLREARAEVQTAINGAEAKDRDYATARTALELDLARARARANEVQPQKRKSPVEQETEAEVGKDATHVFETVLNGPLKTAEKIVDSVNTSKRILSTVAAHASEFAVSNDSKDFRALGTEVYLIADAHLKELANIQTLLARLKTEMLPLVMKVGVARVAERVSTVFQESYGKVFNRFATLASKRETALDRSIDQIIEDVGLQQGVQALPQSDGSGSMDTLHNEILKWEVTAGSRNKNDLLEIKKNLRKAMKEGVGGINKLIMASGEDVVWATDVPPGVPPSNLQRQQHLSDLRTEARRGGAAGVDDAPSRLITQTRRMRARRLLRG
jgi:predicted  nucleic acid-binding Zn-ribbon protein